MYFANSGTASAPAFAASSINPYGLVDVGYDASPTFADLDDDGDLDALVGEWTGPTAFFRNTGSASAPAFAAFSFHAFGLADFDRYGSPAFADLDGDGDLDATIGEGYGRTVVQENTGTASAPAFAGSRSNPFGLTDAGGYANPTFADLDGDGDLDATIGEWYGTVYFANTGTASAPAFAASSLNPFGLYSVGYFASPAFADLDGDGDLDAFISTMSGDTEFFGNTGSASAPAFARLGTNPFGLANEGAYASPTFADLDGDGDLDAFIGNLLGHIVFFRNTPVTPGAWLPLALRSG